MGLCLDDTEAFEETYGRMITIAQAFQMKALHPSILLTLYLSGAQGFMKLGREEKALEILEQYFFGLGVICMLLAWFLMKRAMGNFSYELLLK